MAESLISNGALLSKYLSLQQLTNRVQLTYIWIDGKNGLRSKSRTVDFIPQSVSQLPVLNFDGFSTYQSDGSSTDVYLQPVRLYRDPFRKGNNRLVLCEANTHDGSPTKSNTRRSCNLVMNEAAGQKPWFGIEQEYFMLDGQGLRPFGWPKGGFPNLAEPYFCGVEPKYIRGRDVIMLHYRACLFAGVKLAGKVSGKLIYASQEAWIFNGTVRENILFGGKYDPVRYRDVVRVAALSKNFQQFDQGDQTLVDDRGTSLSGGQRARISLARAIYANADCYLLDDPLSAVDTSVAKHIFEKCIKGYLSDKCVILVTHQLKFIKQADQIVLLKDGGVLGVGSYMELLNRGIDVFKYSAETDQLRQELDNSSSVASIECSQLPSHSIVSNLAPLRLRVDSFNSDVYGQLSRANSFIESDTYGGDQLSILNYVHNVQQDGPKKYNSGYEETHKLHQTECNQTHSSNNRLKIYWQYIRAGAGPLLFLTFLCTNIIAQVLFTGSDYWLSAWTDYQEKSHIQTANPNDWC